MVFEDETSAILSISDYITESAACLFVATKHIYALSVDNFYNCEAKDIFRIVLNNLRSPDRLSALRLSTSGEKCAPVNTAQYGFIRELILYSFAVRLPVFQSIGGRAGLSEAQINLIYETVLLNTSEAVGTYITDSFADNTKRIKKNKAIPPYRCEWLKAYIYGHCPELAAVDNRSLFFMGTIDPLFSMFYIQMEKELGKHILSLGVS